MLKKQPATSFNYKGNKMQQHEFKKGFRKSSLFTKVDKNKILIHEFASDGGGDKKVPNLEPSRAPEKRDVKLPKNYWNCSNKSLTYLRSLFFPKKLHPKPADIQQYVPPQYQRHLSHFQQPQQHRPGTCVGCRKPGYLGSQYE